MINTSLLPKSSLASFILWLEQVWSEYSDTKFDVALVKNPSSLREYNRLTGRIAFPFGLMALTRLNIDLEKGGLSKRHQKITTGISLEDSSARVDTMIPVQMGLIMSFRTDNMNHIFTMFQILTNHGPTLAFKMALDSSGFEVNVQANLPIEMDVPSDSGESNMPYVMELTFILDTWTGTYEKMGLIRTIDVRYNESTGSIANSVSIDARDGNVSELEERSYDYEELFVVKGEPSL